MARFRARYLYEIRMVDPMAPGGVISVTRGPQPAVNRFIARCRVNQRYAYEARIAAGDFHVVRVPRPKKVPHAPNMTKEATLVQDASNGIG
jgi:hypothetical protein